MEKMILLLASLGINFPMLYPTRYGENPHQMGWLSAPITKYFDILNVGKEPSYNNCVVDIETIMLLLRDITKHLLSRYDKEEQAVVIITKHGQSCGLAFRQNAVQAYIDARACDPTSAFGGVVVCNQLVDIEVVKAMKKHFMEVVIGPQFTEEAVIALKEVNPNRIILRYRNIDDFTQKVIVRTFFNDFAVQEPDTKVEIYSDFTRLSEHEVSPSKLQDLEIALLAAKYLKSNCVAFTYDKQLVAIGCGDVSRVSATETAIRKAKENNFDLNGAVMASEAFFPKPDCVALAEKAGVVAVVHPGGSKEDQATVDFANANNIAIYTTGVRHFRH